MVLLNVVFAVWLKPNPAVLSTSVTTVPAVLSSKYPALTVVKPLKLLTPPKYRAPAPCFIKLAEAPEITPERMLLLPVLSTVKVPLFPKPIA